MAHWEKVLEEHKTSSEIIEKINIDLRMFRIYNTVISSDKQSRQLVLRTTRLDMTTG